MTYEEIFNQVNQTKDKYQISNLLGNLTNLKPENEYIDNLKLLTEKQYEVKISALRILSNYNNSQKLELFILDLIKSETNNEVLCICINALHLNGTSKAAEFLLEFYKTTKSRDVKGAIIIALNSLWIRNKVENKNLATIYKLIGNQYPFFQGYWSEIKKAKTTTKFTWKEIAETQLMSNNLNLIFEFSDEIDFHIQIEKMNSNFIRYVKTTCINKNYKTSFSEYFTPRESYLSEDRLFDVLFEKTKQMRPDFYIEKIIKLIEIELLPKLIEKMNTLNLFKTISFSDFIVNQNSIFNTLYETNWDWVLAHQLTGIIDIFKKNPERDRFIDFVSDKWKVCKKESFQIINYLEEQKNNLQ